MDSGNYVLISYSSKNKQKADQFLKILYENGISWWRAPESIPTGRRYPDEIAKAIKNCGCFVLLLSTESQESDDVYNEVILAKNYKKAIIPIQLDDVVLSPGFSYLIGSYHITKVRSINTFLPEMKQIISEIQKALYPNIASLDKSNQVNVKRNTGITKKIVGIIIVFLILGFISNRFWGRGTNKPEDNSSTIEEVIPTPEEIQTSTSSSEIIVDSSIEAEETSDEEKTIPIAYRLRAPVKDFIFPYSSMERLTYSDLMEKFSDMSIYDQKYNSQLAINEIFFRYGWAFNDVSMNDNSRKMYETFNQYDWYIEAQKYYPANTDWYGFETKYMNQIEKDNIELISSWQQDHIPENLW